MEWPSAGIAITFVFGGLMDLAESERHHKRQGRKFCHLLTLLVPLSFAGGNEQETQEALRAQRSPTGTVRKRDKPYGHSENHKMYN